MTHSFEVTPPPMTLFRISLETGHVYPCISLFHCHGPFCVDVNKLSGPHKVPMHHPKMQDLKRQDPKMTDQLVRRDNARPENAGPEIPGPENDQIARHENVGPENGRHEDARYEYINIPDMKCRQRPASPLNLVSYDHPGCRPTCPAVAYGHLNPSSPKRGTVSFWSCLLWPNGRPSQLLLLSTCTSYKLWSKLFLFIVERSKYRP